MDRRSAADRQSAFPNHQTAGRGRPARTNSVTDAKNAGQSHIAACVFLIAL